MDSTPQSVRVGVSDRASSGAYTRIDERHLWVRAALARIPDVTDRMILVLRFFVGLPIPEIAKRLRLDPAEARERYLLAVERMERELKGRL